MILLVLRSVAVFTQQFIGSKQLITIVWLAINATLYSLLKSFIMQEQNKSNTGNKFQRSWVIDGLLRAGDRKGIQFQRVWQFPNLIEISFETIKIGDNIRDLTECYGGWMLPEW